MAEVLAEFADILTDDSGTRYRARACGSTMADGKWQGWLEFIPLDGKRPIRSSRETTQPNHADTLYWATGLTPVYLEGALDRALNPLVVHDPAPAAPAFDEPAAVNHVPAAMPRHDAVLNPFSVYEKGESFLRRQLGAFSSWHLVNIIDAYALSDSPRRELEGMAAPDLIEAIVSGVAASRVHVRSRGD